MDKLGDPSQDELAGDGVAESSVSSRRDFLKKAAGAALALPAAGALAGTGRGRNAHQGRRDRTALRRRDAPVREGPVRQRREGRHREAPRPVREGDRHQGRAHGRPVEHRGRDVCDELRRPEPVRRQLPDEHRPDGPRHEGRARGAEHAEVAEQPELRLDEVEVHPGDAREEHLPGQALRPAVHHRRHGRLLQQGPAREGRGHEDPGRTRPSSPRRRRRSCRRSATGCGATTRR